MRSTHARSHERLAVLPSTDTCVVDHVRASGDKITSTSLLFWRPVVYLIYGYRGASPAELTSRAVMAPPRPGQKWNLLNVVGGLSSFETLVGSFAAKPTTPKTKSMSVHVWKLQAGQTDLQRPHAEEEFYYVLSGKRTLVLSRGTEEHTSVDVDVGDLIYVPARTEHSFEGSSELIVLVIFAPDFSGPT